MGSQTPNFVLSSCVPSDVSGMTEVYIRAFQHDPVAMYCFQPEKVTTTELRRWLHARFTKLFDKSYVHVFKVVDSSTNQVVSFLRWSFPHTLTPAEALVEKAEKEFRAKERKEGRDPDWPVGANLELLDFKFGNEGLGGCFKKYVVDSEMYVAHLLATDPAYQRRGLASMLLQHVLNVADREGRKCYIEATDAGYPLYVKHGWKEVDVVYLDCTKWGGKLQRNRVLIRDPAPVTQA